MRVENWNKIALKPTSYICIFHFVIFHIILFSLWFNILQSLYLQWHLTRLEIENILIFVSMCVIDPNREYRW